jgi:DNA invertase Pin-like site-specific DNA recombinase
LSRRRQLRANAAVGYVRVSTAEQHIGPEAQIHAIRQWCERHGIELVADPYIDKGVSGGVAFEKRPALVEAIGALSEYNAAILVAHKRDRIARGVEVISALKLALRKKGRRICTTERSPSDPEDIDPMARMMEGVQDLFAEFERNVIRKRTKDALKVKRGRSERIGTVPYGYALSADGKSLVEDALEQKMLKIILRLDNEGVGPTAIAAELTRLGFKTKRGGIWRDTSVRRILERSRS